MKNLKKLKKAKSIINKVINDIEKRNDLNDYFIDYDLKNDNYITSEDLDCLASIIETINNILKYNNYSK